MFKDPMTVLVLIVIGAAMVFSMWLFSGQVEGQAVQMPEGQQPYVPTRVEWLAMELNAQSSTKYIEGGSRVLTLHIPDGGNGIDVMVGYTTGTDTAHIRDAEHNAIQNLRERTEFYGWQHWIEHSVERVEMSR